MFRVFLLLLMSAIASAEQEYFTWVDAQGRIHNTPVERKEEPAKVEVKKNQESVSSVSSPESRSEVYLTEDQLEEKLQRERQDNPPFYTYVDPQGVVRNQTIVDSQIEVEDVVSEIIYDHILAPPFRVSQRMSQGCCSRYQSYFKDVIPAEKAVEFSGFLNTIPISTRFGAKQAWYFRLDNPADSRVLNLKLRPADDVLINPVSVILADKQFKALYFIKDLSLLNKPSSWKGTAYSESTIKIDDVNVASVIVYFPKVAPQGASLEVKWWHGKASD